MHKTVKIKLQKILKLESKLVLIKKMLKVKRLQVV